MIIDPSNALCGPGFLPGLRLPERRLPVNRRRRRRGAVARGAVGARRRPAPRPSVRAVGAGGRRSREGRRVGRTPGASERGSGASPSRRRCRRRPPRVLGRPRPSSPSVRAVGRAAPGLRPPKWRPLGEPAGLLGAPGARPRGRSSCPPPSLCVVPERARRAAVGRRRGRRPPRRSPRAAVCGWVPRRRPCRRAAARAERRAWWGAARRSPSAFPPGVGGGIKGRVCGGGVRLPRRLSRVCRLVVRGARWRTNGERALSRVVRAAARFP